MIELTVSKVGRITPATLVSIMPFPIKEEKVGLIPSLYELPASEDGRPVVKIIGEAYYDVYIDAARGSLRVRVPPYEVARSIVYDYLVAQIEVQDDAHPGFFYLEGEHAAADVEKKFITELMTYRRKQLEWFKLIVRRANDDFEKTRSNWSVSDTQRIAATILKIDAPWLLNVNEEDIMAPKEMTTRCRACASVIPDIAVVCPHCHCIMKPEEYKKMQFTE